MEGSVESAGRAERVTSDARGGGWVKEVEIGAGGVRPGPKKSNVSWCQNGNGSQQWPKKSKVS